MTLMYNFTNWTRDIDYSVYSYCSLPTSTHKIPDKWLPVNTSTILDLDDNYKIQNLCFVNEPYGWDSASLITGQPLPDGFTFNSTSQAFVGNISTIGIYTIKMQKTLSSYPVYKAAATFTITVYGPSPIAIGSIPQ